MFRAPSAGGGFLLSRSSRTSALQPRALSGAFTVRETEEGGSEGGETERGGARSGGCGRHSRVSARREIKTLNYPGSKHRHTV